MPTKIDLADVSPKSIALMEKLATTFIETDEGFKAYVERRKQETQVLRLPKTGIDLSDLNTMRVDGEVISQPVTIEVAS